MRNQGGSKMDGTAFSIIVEMLKNWQKNGPFKGVLCYNNNRVFATIC